MKFQIPDNIKTVLNILHDAGFEAYIVGGCVRDFLMGKIPHDYDICTSAEPEQIKECFSEFTTIETGIKFGTVVVVSEGENVEVTTYRIDGAYSDSRHPETVSFTNRLKEDLARRDFTINALAYCEEKGVIDFFNGKEDIEKAQIIAVGNPEKRFKEDALRMMRALRFASVLDFTIEKSTDKAIKKLISQIDNVSKERIQTELSKLIMGINADNVIDKYEKLLTENIEGFRKAKVNNMPENLAYRLGILFPERTGFYLKKLKYDNKTISQAKAVSEIRKEKFPESKTEILYTLKKYGENVTRLYFQENDKMNCLNEILENKPCYSIKQLAVSGSDLIMAGINKGPELGKKLETILNLVIEDKLENNKETIMEYVKGDIR